MFLPLESNPDPFRENINLLVQDQHEKISDPNQYVEMSENQLPTYFPDGKILESERIKTKNTEYHKVIYTGSHGQFKLKFESYWWYYNDHAYVLTFTCEEEKFDSFKEIAEKVLSSFELK